MENNQDASCGTIPPEEVRRIANRERSKVTDKCIKCKTEKSTLVFRRESTCWKCYEQLILKKFKSQISLKTKNRSEPVFIAFSGGPSSRALIDILYQTVEGKNKAAAYFELKGIIHIDEGTILGLTCDELKEKEEKIKKIAEFYRIPLFITQLEKIYEIRNLAEELEEDFDGIIKGDLGNVDQTSQQKLKEMFEKCRTNTSREDLLFHLRNLLIAYVSKSNGVEKVLMGTSANRMASTLISLVCKGRGFTVPQEIGNESKFYGIAFGFPMKDLLTKEVSMYNRFKDLESIFVPTLDTKTTNPKFSIDHLTESFIEELQVDFNHTVHTLLRSSGKLNMKDSANPFRCSMCSGSLTHLEVANANKISSQMEKECCGNGSCSDTQREKDCKEEKIQLELFLCGGCKRVLKEMEEETLPSFVESHASKTQNSFRLREQIKDYLIE